MATGEVELAGNYIESGHYGSDGYAIVGQTLTTLKNDFAGFLGFKFTTGGTALVVTRLGRWKFEDSTNTHIVRIYASNGTTVVAEVTVNLTTGAAGGYVYANLSSSVTLTANTTYFLVSQEAVGGSKWYDTLSINAVAGITINQPAYQNGSTITGGDAFPDKSYGLLNFYSPTLVVNNYGVDQLQDGDFSTGWSALNGANSWFGVDAKVAAIPTRFIYSPQGNYNSSFPTEGLFESRVVGGQLQGDSVSNFSGPTTLSTLGSFPFRPRNQYNEITLSGSTAYRFLRFITTAANTYGGSPTEAYFVVNASGITTARPCRPIISPAGGHYSSGNARITLSSYTTSASIYYTTDGTTPTNTNGTLYAGPFMLTVGTTTTLKVVAYDSTLSTTLSRVNTAVYRNYSFKAGDDIVDSNGNLVQAFGGNIVQVAGVYYWVGASTNLGQDALNTPDIPGNKGVWLYKSYDLVNWQIVGNILDNTTQNWKWIERPKLFQVSASSFVIWAHGTTNHDGTDRACVASASSVEGPWTWQNASLNPDGVGFKDCNISELIGGFRYVVYTDGAQSKIYISRLSANGLTTDGNFVVAINQEREAPILFQRGNTLFLITSKSNYYDSASTFDIKYQVLSGNNPLATWPAYSTAVSLFSSDPTATIFNAQPTQVLTVPGKDGYIYLADRWVLGNLYASRVTFLPLKFATATTVQATTPATWGLDDLPTKGAGFF